MKNNSKKSEDIENVEQRLEEIYNKILNIIDITNTTSDEYYENIVFAEAQYTCACHRRRA